jgi:hypothetical protein
VSLSKKANYLIVSFITFTSRIQNIANIMKQKPTYRPLIILAIALSAGSSAYVNIHAALHRQQVANAHERLEAKQEVSHDEDERNLPVPDVSAVMKVVETVGKLLPAIR